MTLRRVNPDNRTDAQRTGANQTDRALVRPGPTPTELERARAQLEVLAATIDRWCAEVLDAGGGLALRLSEVSHDLHRAVIALGDGPAARVRQFPANN